MRYAFVVACILSLVAMSALDRANAADEQSTARQAAYGAGSALGTFVYAPLKASFCILSAVGSGFTFVVAPETAKKVVGAGCGGSWVITPAAVAGQEPVRVVGVTR